ncbi:MAG TPA: hypothetical protein PKJ08_03440 [Candidatus Cloacimonadota bacterium]|nr:hypothetical protein [Candidatus Cloacimonadota bacterium]HOD53562.1 hypothetical protein [Candidatus Cloacimonadota bacterium]
MKRTLFIVFMLISCSIFAERIQEISNPTAGILKKGEAKIYTKIYKDNGMITGASVGLFDSFMFGFTYGGEELVGDKKPLWHDKVDFNARFRLIDETTSIPAIVIGFDSQGHGKYYKEEKRYDIKSKGFYTVASKNFNFLGLFGLDAGLNYSLENHDNDKDLNVFCGAYKTIGKSITAIAEYDFATNDNQKHPLHGKGNGYFNAGLELQINDQFSIKVLAHDIFMNRPFVDSFNRSVQINYRWNY